ncbi:MAG: DUF2334 domain-containing protein [Sciscionella sp.]
MAGTLLLSLSGISTATLPACGRFLDAARGLGVRTTLLIGPRSLTAPLLDWLGEYAEPVAMHGFDSQLRAGGGRRGLRPAGEFAAIGAHEAQLRLTAARRIFDAAGLRADCFVPPRWAASLASRTVLLRNGFRLCPLAGAVLDLQRGTSWPSRVITLGASGQPRSRVLQRATRGAGLLRYAVRAEDLARTGVLPGALRTLQGAVANGVDSIGYPELAAPPAIPAPRMRRTAGPADAEQHWAQTA